ncbi:MAG: hypothetical protein M3Y75_02330 [Actinomycetota bacterium]|nr:hypothetical protein [Actinomycetota bacterium]
MTGRSRFEQFDQAERLLLQIALVNFKHQLEGDGYSIILSRLVDEAHRAPAEIEGPLPGTRRDFEAVLRNLGVHDAEIEGTRDWSLAEVEALVQAKAEEHNPDEEC